MKSGRGVNDVSMLQWKPERGRSKLDWLQEVKMNLNSVRIKEWKKKTKYRKL